MPETPPTVTVKPSAAATLRRLAVLTGLGAVASTLAMLVGTTGGQMSWPALAGVLVITAAAVPVLARATTRWGDALVLEACSGYTTAPATTARWWGLPAPSRQVRSGWGTPWDFTGLWHLTEDGAVVEAPDLSIDPPGIFPGPDGEWALWTGVVWVDYRPAGWEAPHA